MAPAAKLSAEDERAFDSLELRIKTILPEEYQECYDEVEPVSMGSAGLKFGRDGKVAWQDIWDTFCDLAMAGGPPHKGKLLQPASREEIDAQPARYRDVVGEIGRGIDMVSGLAATASPVPGWVRVQCASPGMAGWLARAITMENVAARCEGAMLDLPAGPDYRLEKEIKNVITVIAKSCHYWLDHMWSAQQRVIGELFATMEMESPLIQPALGGYDFRPDTYPLLRQKMSASIRQMTGLSPLDVPCAGWLGVECPSVRAAIWMMRAMVASNVLSRREEKALFVPINPVTDPSGDRVVRVTTRVHGFAKARRVV